MNVPNLSNISDSVYKFQHLVNKRRKFLISAHGILPRNNRIKSKFKVPDNVAIVYLAPYDTTIGPLNKNMHKFYMSKKAMNILEKNYFTTKGPRCTTCEKPVAIQNAIVAPPGLYTYDLDISFTNFDNTSNSKKQWERNELGIYSMPVRTNFYAKTNNGQQHKLQRFHDAFKSHAGKTSLKDLATTLSRMGKGFMTGGILIIDTCRATSPYSSRYCRVKGCLTGLCNTPDQHIVNTEKEVTRIFLDILRKTPRYPTRHKKKVIALNAQLEKVNSMTNNIIGYFTRRKIKLNFAKMYINLNAYQRWFNRLNRTMSTQYQYIAAYNKLINELNNNPNLLRHSPRLKSKVNMMKKAYSEYNNAYRFASNRNAVKKHQNKMVGARPPEKNQTMNFKISSTNT